MGLSYILANDPRGLPVEFSDSRWNWIVSKHPDLLEYHVTEAHLKAAIENPSDGCIYESNKKYQDCNLYYTKYSSALQIRVVVRYVAGIGEILTAHFLKERSSGESLVWMKGKSND